MVILSVKNHSPTTPSSDNFRMLNQTKYLYGLSYLNEMTRDKLTFVLHEY